MRTTRETLRIAALFVLLTIVMTWPQAASMRTQVAAHFDAYFNMWRLGWIAHQLPIGPRALFDANIFYPQRLTLALSDPILLPGLCAAPLLWLKISPVLVYNLLVLASFVLCGTAAWALASRLTGSSAAGVVAGIVFAFTPYRFDHYYHLEILWGFWIPLALLMLHHATERGSAGDAVRTGLLVIAQAVSCLYYAVYLGTTLMVAAPLLLRWRERASLRVLAGLAAGALAAVAAVLLYVEPLRAIRHELVSRDIAEVQIYSATPASYFSTPPENRLYGPLTAALGSAELRLFPGIAAIALATGALRRPTRMVLVYVAILALAVVASFGFNAPLFPLMSQAAQLGTTLRVPARFGAVALCAMAVLSAIGVAALLETIRSARARRTLVGAICAVMLIEYSTTMRLEAVRTTRASVYRWLASAPRGPVAELPMPHFNRLPGREPQREFFSTAHWQPLLNGYSGYYPLSYHRLIFYVSVFPRGSWIELLLGRGARYIVVHERELERDILYETLRRLEFSPRVKRVGRFPDAEDPTWVYERVVEQR